MSAAPVLAPGLVELAVRAGWTVHAGPHDGGTDYTMTVWPDDRLKLSYFARWRPARTGAGWTFDFAERRTTTTGHQLTLHELRTAIGGGS